MKAIVFEKYGSPEVLKLKDVEKPTPGDNEVLIKVHAASIAFSDVAIVKGEPFIARLWSGLLKPKNSIPGSDMSGKIERVGKNVKLLQPGDEVYGDLSECGFGAYAEFVCADEKALALKPSNISFVEAAAVPMSAVTALQGLRFKGQIRPGQKVLINGASGGVGTFAIQIAKSYGAVVTAVCSTGKMDPARLLGADFVIDYTKEDFTQKEDLYDLIIAVNGYHPILDYKRVLSSQGIYVQIGGTGAQIAEAMLLGPLVSIKGSKKLCSMGVAKPDNRDLIIIKELIEAGKVVPVIDKRYSLSEVPEAFQYFDEGHSNGKAVITMEQTN